VGGSPYLYRKKTCYLRMQIVVGGVKKMIHLGLMLFVAVGCMKVAINFSISTITFRLLPHQLIWFVYVLDFAMQGDLNLKNNGFYKQKLARSEEYIMSNQEHI